MLYHPQSPYYRQFLTQTSRKQKKVENIIQQQVTKSMPNVNPGSVGLWSDQEHLPHLKEL